jgi:glutaredoxin
MRIIRFILGRLILLINWITLPKPVVRSQPQQDQLDHVTQHLTVYEMLACPFCVKVRREIHRQGLKITTVDVKQSADEMDRLVNEGGKFQVPCLRVDTSSDTISPSTVSIQPSSTSSDKEKVQWIYESDEIIEHIQSLTNSAQNA